MTLIIAYSGCEKSSFLFNGRIGDWVATLLRVSDPVRKGSLNIRKFSLDTLYRRNASVLREQVLFPLAEYFGYGARK